MKLVKGEISSVELTTACLEQIEKYDGKINAFVTVTKDEALEQAKRADGLIKSEKATYLTGVPFAVKDVIMTKGIETTASSNILKGYKASFTATGVQKILDQGGVLLGKTNCDAFAHGASTENSDFFPTKNPWDIERVPGGSSGGSAAAVAARMVPYALGTDTGGSIRQPAALTNLVGLKPTYGRVSRYGLIAMTSSTDCLSVVSRDVNDSAIVLEAMAGEDVHDATAARLPVPDFTGAVREGLPESLRVGVPRAFFEEGVEKGVLEAIEKAIEEFEKMGMEIIDIPLPMAKRGVAVYYILTPSELSSNLERFDGIRYQYSAETDPEENPQNLYEVYTKTRGKGFGAEAKRRIMTGTFALSSGYYDAYYKKASRVRTAIINEFDEAFKSVDYILTPTSPSVAFKIGEKVVDPLSLYLEDIFLAAVSLAGLPAVSVPCGFASPEDNPDVTLPVGLQLIAPRFGEAKMLRVAKVYEQITDWHKKSPSLAN